MKKLSIFILILLFFSSVPSIVHAAIVTVDKNGKVIWQVLGDSTLEVKSVASNIAYTNGKIELSNTGAGNAKEDLVEVVARGNTNDLKIGTNGNQFTIEENGITANTSFPITIDPVKNELTVTTASGSRLLSILPFEATEALTRANFIDNVKGNIITLNENQVGQLAYSISGTKNINIFNLAKISGDVTSTVSASNGEILKVDEPQWLRLLGVIL